MMKNNPVSTNVGRRIKDARKSLRMSGGQLAQLTGLSQQQVSRYESGKTSMTIDTVVMIAHALDISLSKILSDYLPAPENEHELILANYRSKSS